MRSRWNAAPKSRLPPALARRLGEWDAQEQPEERDHRADDEEIAVGAVREHDAAEQRAERHRDHPGHAEHGHALGALRRRDDVGGVGEERAEERADREALDGAHAEDPGADRVDGEVEQARREVQHPAAQDHDAPPRPVHEPARPRADRDRRAGRGAEHQPHDRLPRAEPRHEAREVEEGP